MSGKYPSIDSGLFSSPGDIILLPLMGYPAERDAIFLALVTADCFGANLKVLHFVNKSSRTENYFFEKQLVWLNEEAKKLQVPVETIIKEPLRNVPLKHAIVDEIKALAPKLTVMMSRRKGLLQRFTGSIAEHVARASPYSVMIIRSPVRDWVTYSSRFSPRKIIVPMGRPDPYELSAVQIAIALAKVTEAPHAEITLLHVIVVPETVPILSDDNQLIISEEKEFIKLAGQYSIHLLYPMNTKVIVGRDVGRSVSQYINKEHADIVIMGVSYVPRRFFGLFGTDTNTIYNKSKSPVAVIFHKDIC